MQSGACTARPKPEPHTSGNGCGSLLPTPTATQYGSTNNGQRPDGTTYKQAGKPSLFTMARHGTWPRIPIPTVGDSQSSGSRNTAASKAHPGTSLTDFVRGDGGRGRKWLTPTAHNAKEGAYPSEYMLNTPTLAAQAGGKLNPTWVEWLMGWPLGWTDCDVSATDRFRQWCASHGVPFARLRAEEQGR